jgi:protein phosphatase
VYYDAVDLRCANPQCHHGHTAFPADGLCVRCNVPLEPVLVHEWRTTNQDIIPQNIRGQLLRLGQSQHPYILYHREILSFQQATYTVVNHPGRWGVLIKGRRPRPIDEVLGSVAQVGKAINYLHQQGYSLNWPAPSYEPGAFERMINAPGRGDVRLASVSSCAPLQEKTRQAQIARDVALLGQLMLLLSSDVPSLPAEPAQAPAELRPFVERALRGQYPNVTKMLSDLSGSAPPPPAPARSLKPIHGQASHPGRKHDRNEDAILTFTYDKEQQGKSIPIAFYLVADGMGGHDAGDLASRTVNRIVTEWVLNTKVLPDLRKSTRKLTDEHITEELLQQAVQAANDALTQHAQARGSDLGSTITAALIIGSVATVVNVGDSRTYLLRKGDLCQITQDHSLVARLVAAHVIKPEEVRSHPQRNQIYRSLGHETHVEVDTFTVPLQRGDRLILCCDGLWEMVLDPEIQRIVENARTPQQACDALVDAANQAGGEDNISVVVVEIE